MDRQYDDFDDFILVLSVFTLSMISDDNNKFETDLLWLTFVSKINHASPSLLILYGTAHASCFLKKGFGKIFF